MTPKILSALLVSTLFSSCTLSTNCVVVEGPNKGAVVKATFFYAGTGSGKVEAVAPWGERASGRYLTQTGGIKSKAWQSAQQRENQTTLAHGESTTIVAEGSTQVGTATLIGDQGTTWDITYWTARHSPRHGQGKGQDSRGNKYRMVW